MKSSLIFVGFLVIFTSRGQVLCENGMAGNYPCQNINLIAHLSPSQLLAEGIEGRFLNDIWGWTDELTSHEYALVGMTNGTSFVDITDPVAPVMLGILPEHETVTSNNRIAHEYAKSIWRDIKVFNNYAFIVSEDSLAGMQVFDLTQLRDVINPPQTFSETAHYDGIGNSHNIIINEETGYAYIAGAKNEYRDNCSQGGLHIVDINNPLDPVYVSCFDDDGYTHDGQCVIYIGPDTEYFGKEICFNANEDNIAIVDVMNKFNTTLLSSFEYETSTYVHQLWLTPDQKYLLVNDELDELFEIVESTTTYIFDIQNLKHPKLIGSYIHSGNAIDHNLYINGNYAYQSNYSSGLVVLDVSDISSGNLKKIAYFDTYPASNVTEFVGQWSNYPFFESGNIVVSDINEGLFILDVDLNDVLLGSALEKNALQIYPNPASDLLRIKLDNNQSLKALYIRSLDGKIHYKGESLNIDISFLTSGIYIVSIETNLKKFHRKLVVE